MTLSFQVSSLPCCFASTSGNRSPPFFLLLMPNRDQLCDSFFWYVPLGCETKVLNCPSSHSLKKNSRTYFYSGFLAYIFGLGLTIFVMHTFKHAQVWWSLSLCTWRWYTWQDRCSLSAFECELVQGVRLQYHISILTYLPDNNLVSSHLSTACSSIPGASLCWLSCHCCTVQRRTYRDV